VPFPLSSRAKPRDLRFRGPFLKTRNTMLKQDCHLACSGPCHFSFNPPAEFIAGEENSL
jgi:hypothetical protein